jgi:uncharacterized membrane protein YhaH (DUF805 family)
LCSVPLVFADAGRHALLLIWRTIMDLKSLFFSFTGRINRAKYWLGILILFVALFAVSAVAFLIMWAVRDQYVLNIVLGVAFQIVGIWASLGLYIKRLHDRDKSGWWLLLFYGAPFGLMLATFYWFGMFALMSNPNMPPDPNQIAAGPIIIATLAGMGIALWGFVEIACLRGTEGPNRFGPDPLPPQD